MIRFSPSWPDRPILPVTTKQTFFDRIPCPWESTRIYIANKYGLPILFPVLGWYGTWLPKRRPIHMKTHPSRYIEKDIEQERQTYYKSIIRLNSQTYLSKEKSN